MYKEKEPITMGASHPAAWKRIGSERYGQFFTEGGLYTFDTVQVMGSGLVSYTGAGEAFKPSAAKVSAGDYKWKVVTYLSARELSAARTITTLNLWAARDDEGYWQQVDSYISEHTQADISHSVCLDCMEVNYPEEFELIMEDRRKGKSWVFDQRHIF